MSAPDISEEHTQLFNSLPTNATTTILLGAGASAASGLPMWDDFARRLLIASGVVPSEESAGTLIQRQDPLIAVEAAKARLGLDWDQELIACLYPADVEPEPSSLHLAAAAHLLSRSPDSTHLVTLNFDVLLEAALQEARPQLPVESATQLAPTVSSVPVHHLHGVISADRADAVVLTHNDFTDLVANTDSWQARYISDRLRSGSLIIAGTSYRDPDLRLWLRQALNNHGHKNSAFVLLAREAFEMTKEAFDDIKDALKEQWTAIGITPILLEDHADAAQLIRELVHLECADYLTPQQRSVQLWTHHEQNFDRLQSDYADALQRQAARLVEVSNQSKMSLSLWLADGDGSVVRFAAHDRLFRDPSLLRRVDTGHDSPWIAGQALGRGTILAQELPPASRRRWNFVLAVPIEVQAGIHEPHASAVITLGLNTDAVEVADGGLLEVLVELADEWTNELSRAHTAQEH